MSFLAETSCDNKGISGFQSLGNDLVVAKFLLILFFNIVWIFFVPGAASIFENAYSSSDIEKIAVRKGYSKALDEIHARQVHDSFMKTLEERYKSASINLDFDKLRITKEMMEQERSQWQNRRPIALFASFETNLLNHIWLFSYVSLSVLIFLLRHPNARLNSFQPVILYGFFVYLLFNWPNWVRNYNSASEARSIFSWVHADIAPICFILQEFRIYAWCCLFVCFWNLWLQSARDSDDGSTGSSYSKTCSQYIRMLEETNLRFARWQVDSVAVAGVYLPMTYFFWYQVVRAGDMRYVTSALILHFLWGFGWFVVTLPLILSLRQCSKLKLALVLNPVDDLSKSTNPFDEYSRINELKPIEYNKLSASIAAALISFVFPVLQLLF